MMQERKRARSFVYHGFGFPLVLENVPMVKVRGVWTPDVRYNAIQRVLLAVLAAKPCRLTGQEVHFIRLSQDLTLSAFARRFGVTHPAVLKWERAGGRPTGMTWTTEKDVRLFALTALNAKPTEFVGVYRRLETPPSGRTMRLRIDASRVA
jgi:hypothetical protein